MESAAGGPELRLIFRFLPDQALTKFKNEHTDIQCSLPDHVAFGYVFACARPIAEAIELSMYSSSRALVQVLNESEQVRAFFLQLAVLGNPREVRVTDEWNETSTLSVQEPHC